MNTSLFFLCMCFPFLSFSFYLLLQLQFLLTSILPSSRRSQTSLFFLASWVTVSFELLNVSPQRPIISPSPILSIHFLISSFFLPPHLLINSLLHLLLPPQVAHSTSLPSDSTIVLSGAAAVSVNPDLFISPDETMRRPILWAKLNRPVVYWTTWL